MHRYFCRVCGSPMFLISENPAMDGMVGFTAGTLRSNASNAGDKGNDGPWMSGRAEQGEVDQDGGVAEQRLGLGRPAYELFCGQRWAWVKPADGATAFDTLPNNT